MRFGFNYAMVSQCYQLHLERPDNSVGIVAAEVQVNFDTAEKRTQDGLVMSLRGWHVYSHGAPALLYTAPVLGMSWRQNGKAG